MASPRRSTRATTSRLSDAYDDDGVLTPTLGRSSDPDSIEAVTQAIAKAPVVVVDGHHRFETAWTYRAEYRAPTATTMVART